MRVVLLGGTGFIGKHFAKLCQSFSEVVVVGRSLPSLSEHLVGVRYLQGDCASKEFLTSVIKPGDHVVYLAYNTVPKTSFDNPLRDIQENLPLAINLLEILRFVKIKRLLYVSSGGTVYGKSIGLAPINEDHQTNPISPYGITKLSIEKYCTMYSQLFDVPVVIARPSNPFGPHQVPFAGQGFISTAAALMIRGEPLSIFGENGTIRDYIYIDDLCSAMQILLSLDLPSGSIYNIGTGIGMNNIDMINAIANVANIKRSKLQFNFLPHRHFDVPYNVLSISRLQALGWHPKTDIESGLKSTFTWLKNHLINI